VSANFDSQAQRPDACARADGTSITAAPLCCHIDNAIVKAIARAFRWREMLENGTQTTVAEIAAVEKINASYVGRVLRLTLLAPDIVEALPDGRQPGRSEASRLLKKAVPARSTPAFCAGL